VNCLQVEQANYYFKDLALNYLDGAPVSWDNIEPIRREKYT
jgi:hypothetical protein